MCYPGIHEYTSDDGISRETTEGPGLRKNNLVRIIMGAKKADNRKWMKKKLVRSTWVGHVEKLGDDKLDKWKKYIDRRNWRLLKENVVREK